MIKLFEQPSKRLLGETPGRQEVFWEVKHKYIRAITHDVAKEDFEKARLIAELRLEYLSKLLEGVNRVPESRSGERTQEAVVSFYHHSAGLNKKRVLEILGEGLIPPHYLRPELGGNLNKRLEHRAAKVRKLIDKDIIPTLGQPDISLLPDYESYYSSGMLFIIDPNFLHKRGLPLPYSYTPGEVRSTIRISPRAFLGLYYIEPYLDSFVVRNAILTVLEQKASPLGISDKQREFFQEIIKFFEVNPDKAIPIFASVKSDEDKYRHLLVWPKK